MSATVNNRTYGYDNIAAGSPYGLEQGQSAPPTINENISVGNPIPINLERGPGSSGVVASDSGTEIP